jgi:hypothetical protein
MAQAARIWLERVWQHAARVHEAEHTDKPKTQEKSCGK